MKTRQGFVSNSSSSSFVISKEHLTDKQIREIYNHIKIDKKQSLYCGCSTDSLNFPWQIEENDYTLSGSVSMDNFDMWKFMKTIGVDPEKAEWNE